MEEEIIKYFKEKLNRVVDIDKHLAVEQRRLKGELNKIENEKRVIADEMYKIKTALEYLGAKNV